MPTPCEHQNTLCCLPCKLLLWRSSSPCSGNPSHVQKVRSYCRSADKPRYPHHNHQHLLVNLNTAKLDYCGFDVCLNARANAQGSCDEPKCNLVQTRILYTCMRNVWVQHRNLVHVHMQGLSTGQESCIFARAMFGYSTGISYICTHIQMDVASTVTTAQLLSEV